MATSAESILINILEDLNDPGFVQWSPYDLIGYLNWGLREISVYRPDLFTVTASVALVAGAKQTLPEAAVKFVEITRNTSGRERAIKRTTRELMDSFNPAWTTARSSTEIQHYTYDMRDPRVFYVYPPAAAGASVEMVYTTVPANMVTNVASPEAIDHVQGNVPIPDTLAPALGHYVLHRAFSRETEATLNPQKAAEHYQRFMNHLTVDGGAVVEIGPNSPSNPNKVSARTGV